MSNMPALVVVSQKSWLIRADFFMFSRASVGVEAQGVRQAGQDARVEPRMVPRSRSRYQRSLMPMSAATYPTELPAAYHRTLRALTDITVQGAPARS